jgi:N-methylhydantoinase B
MFVANDPYTGGGTHLPDINVIAPVFVGKRIVSFVANIAHHADVGGMVPGSEAAVCKSIFQEGIRIPPVRIMRAGRLNRDVVDIICSIRARPDERIGDSQGTVRRQQRRYPQRAAAIRALRRAETARTIASYLDFTEKRFAAAISRLPRGRYVAEDFLDGNAPGEKCADPPRLDGGARAARVRFSPAPASSSKARATSVPRAARDGLHGREKPARSGSCRERGLLPHAENHRAARLRGGPGAACRDRLPLDLGERPRRCHRERALAGDARQALAGSGPHHLYVLAGTDPRDGRYFVNYETLAGGMGARANPRRLSTACACTRRARPTCRLKPSSTLIRSGSTLRAVGGLGGAPASITAAWAWCATIACSPTTSW